MKTLIIILCILCCACQPEKPSSTKETFRIAVAGSGIVKYIEFDGHEYVYYHRPYGSSLCHSPKCPCLEQYKK